jgi:hypothetical protein
MTVLYHGSPKRFSVLRAKNEHGDPTRGGCVFAAPVRRFALVFASQKWSDCDLDLSAQGSERMILREMRPGAFEDAFCKRGYLYSLPSEGFTTLKRGWRMEVVHRTGGVKPLSVERVHALSELESDPLVELHCYDAKSPASLAAVKRQVKRLREMTPSDAADYLRWRLEPAPPEIQALFMRELARSPCSITLQHHLAASPCSITLQHHLVRTA